MKSKMKRFLALILATSVVIAGVPSIANAAEETRNVSGVIGDANNSGVLDVKDLVRYKSVLGGSRGDSFAEGFASDLNADEICDENDINIERKLLAGTAYEYSDTSWAQAATTSMYGHGFIQNPSGVNEGWNAVAIPHDTEKETEVLTKSGKYLYIPSETTKTAFLHASGYAKSAAEYDLAYEYTMPCKATIDVTLTASVHSADVDGATVYAYINDSSNCVINRTVITGVGSEGRQYIDVKGITLNAGDKIYFCLNKKESTPDAELTNYGYFYAKVTYVGEMPADSTFEGDALKEGWELMAGTKVYTHGCVGKTVENLQATAIKLATGEETALVTGAVTNPKTLYVDDGTGSAYVNASGMAQTSETHDLAYVYTMPWKAKIDVSINASVTNADSDGVIVYAYVNNPSNCIINRTYVTRTTNGRVAFAENITLNAGDKIYIRLNKRMSSNKDAGYFYGLIQFTDTAPAKDVTQGEAYEENTWKEMAGSGSLYGHANLTNTTIATNWERKAILVGTEKSEDLVTGTTTNTLYVNDGKESAYLNSSGKAQTSNTHDLAYIYTMPVTAKIDLAVTASVSSGSDGVVVYVYVNTKDRGLIRTVVTDTNKDAYSVKGITLQKGDKIYFRLNCNGTTTGDNQYFYAAVAFLNEEPDTIIYQGNPFGESVTWAEMASGKGIGSGTSTVVNHTSGITQSHGSISDATTYAGWEYKSVELATGTESDLVIVNNQTALRYVNGDTKAYVRSSAMAQSGAKHDLMYVYTMPVTAKVNITLNASVKDADSDGVYVYCYVNDKSNTLINELITTTSKSQRTANGIVLEKGSKVYFRLNKNGTTTSDLGYFYGSITYLNEAPIGEPVQGENIGVVTWAERANGVGTVNGETIAHTSITAPDTYPGWEYKSVELATGNIVDTYINEKYPDVRYVNASGSSYMRANNNGYYVTCTTNDLLYVYTMPCKAKVNLSMKTSVASGSDGVIATCYVNDVSNEVMRYLEKNTTAKTYSADGITLNKGDKIYFRLNCNSTATNDKGIFNAIVTFVDEAPDTEVYQGAQSEGVTWAELASGNSIVEGVVNNKGTTYSHASISSPATYKYWSAKAVNLATGETTDMVKESNTMYITGDTTKTAYLNSNYESMTSETHDLLLEYTMPCKAKVNITLYGAIGSTNSDGAIASCYVNEPTNYVIDSTLITHVYTSDSKATTIGSKNGVILDKGDKIYFRLNKNQTTTDDKGTFYARIIFATEAPFGEIYSQASEHTLLATDMTNGGVVMLNADALDASNTLILEDNTSWSWYPDTVKGWSGKSLKDEINDIKVRWSSYWQRQVVIMTASGHWAGIADYATGDCLYEWTELESNAVTIQPHAIEMLPNGDVIIATTGEDTENTSETKGQLHYMHMENGVYRTTSTVNLHSAHGVLWDPTEGVVWALGYQCLYAYEIDSNYQFVRCEGKGITFTQKGGHALSADYGNPDILWISTGANVLQYSKSSNELVTSYTNASTLLTLQKIKGIASFGDGLTAYVVGDGSGVLSSNDFNYAGNGFSTIDRKGKVSTFTFSNMATYKIYNFTTSYGGEVTGSLNLEYDDRYTFDSAIVSVTTISVNSNQVGTETLDAAVLQIDGQDDATCVATGVGMAKVLLENGEIYSVTVSPATISVALIIGQSNAEGSTNATGNKEGREANIASEEGKVYTTYAWSTAKYAAHSLGITTDEYLTSETAKKFVATSLTSDTSYADTNLVWSLDSFVAGGNGKLGIDSALGYQWNKLTGEKIWVVNCAAGGTSITKWLPGEEKFETCKTVMSYVNQTMTAEINAGHYTLNKFVYFWCQGESDSTGATAMTQEEYYESLKSVHTGLKETLSLKGKTLDYGGNILVRAYATKNGEADVANTGVRLAQKQATAETTGAFADFYMACDINDQWITDKAVINYWEGKYPNSAYPFSFTKVGYTNPTKESQVYGGVHYYQMGYNEIGITCAENAIAVLY